MNLTARQKIVGITNDEGLRAVDGIKSFEADAKTPEELINRFENENPDFPDASYEIFIST